MTLAWFQAIVFCDIVCTEHSLGKRFCICSSDTKTKLKIITVRFSYFTFLKADGDVEEAGTPFGTCDKLVHAYDALRLHSQILLLPNCSRSQLWKELPGFWESQNYGWLEAPTYQLICCCGYKAEVEADTEAFLHTPDTPVHRTATNKHT